MAQPEQPGQPNYYQPDIKLEHNNDEENNFFENKRNRTILIVAGVALALVSAVGIGAKINASAEHKQTTRETTINPEIKIPAEAKEFVAEYGARYDDPISTYYAEKSFGLDVGKSVLISNESINNYDMSAPMDESSQLIGFEQYQFPPNKEISQNNATWIFNEFTAPQLTLYINALAKNPNPEIQKIIDYEFINYCSDRESQEDYKYINTLMDTCKAIVDEHGSNTNFTIGKGIIYHDPMGTYINEYVSAQGEPDEKGIVNKFSANAEILLTTTTYNREAVVKKSEVIGAIQFLYSRQSIGNNLSLGQIGHINPVGSGSLQQP